MSAGASDLDGNISGGSSTEPDAVLWHTPKLLILAEQVSQSAASASSWDSIALFLADKFKSVPSSLYQDWGPSIPSVSPKQCRAQFQMALKLLKEKNKLKEPDYVQFHSRLQKDMAKPQDMVDIAKKAEKWLRMQRLGELKAALLQIEKSIGNETEDNIKKAKNRLLRLESTSESNLDMSSSLVASGDIQIKLEKPLTPQQENEVDKEKSLDEFKNVKESSIKKQVDVSSVSAEKVSTQKLKVLEKSLKESNSPVLSPRISRRNNSPSISTSKMNNMEQKSKPASENISSPRQKTRTPSPNKSPKKSTVEQSVNEDMDVDSISLSIPTPEAEKITKTSPVSQEGSRKFQDGSEKSLEPSSVVDNVSTSQIGITGSQEPLQTSTPNSQAQMSPQQPFSTMPNVSASQRLPLNSRNQAFVAANALPQLTKHSTVTVQHLPQRYHHLMPLPHHIPAGSQILSNYHPSQSPTPTHIYNQRGNFIPAFSPQHLQMSSHGLNVGTPFHQTNGVPQDQMVPQSEMISTHESTKPEQGQSQGSFVPPGMYQVRQLAFPLGHGQTYPPGTHYVQMGMTSLNPLPGQATPDLGVQHIPSKEDGPTKSDMKNQAELNVKASKTEDLINVPCPEQVSASVPPVVDETIEEKANSNDSDVFPTEDVRPQIRTRGRSRTRQEISNEESTNPKEAEISELRDTKSPVSSDLKKKSILHSQDSKSPSREYTSDIDTGKEVTENVLSTDKQAQEISADEEKTVSTRTTRQRRSSSQAAYASISTMAVADSLDDEDFFYSDEFITEKLLQSSDTPLEKLSDSKAHDNKRVEKSKKNKPKEPKDKSAPPKKTIARKRGHQEISNETKTPGEGNTTVKDKASNKSVVEDESSHKESKIEEEEISTQKEKRSKARSTSAAVPSSRTRSKSRSVAVTASKKTRSKSKVNK